MKLVLLTDGSCHKTAELHIRLVVVASKSHELGGLVYSVLTYCTVKLVHTDVAGFGSIEHPGFLRLIQKSLVSYVIFVNPVEDINQVLLEILGEFEEMLLEVFARKIFSLAQF